MFKKSYNIKSNTQLKGSERKGFKEVILKKFKTFTENDLELLMPKKEPIYCAKVITWDEKRVSIYIIQKQALLFCYDDMYFPTLMFLWKFPDLIETFTTNSFVISKIIGGANFMLPGLIKNPDQTSFLAKRVSCINTTENMAAVAVGVTAMSYIETTKSDNGRFINVYHYFGDYLCQQNDVTIIRVPDLGKPKWLSHETDQLSNSLESPENVGSTDIQFEGAPEEPIVVVTDDVNCVDSTKLESFVSKETEVAEMNMALEKAFLTAIKYSKSLKLPILVSTFYNSEILANTNLNQQLDIKKSSYKKVGIFLKRMQEDGLIDIAEKKKGVETIEKIYTNHQKFLSHYVELENRPRKTEETINENSTEIKESYVITANVSPIFKEFGFNKGDNIQTSSIRQHVTNYVKARNCLDPNNRRFILLTDPHLASLCKNETSVTWEDLINKIISLMGVSFKVTYGDLETHGKGKLPFIMMSVQTRSGNKKVTLVDNLEVYNIKLVEFSKDCQHGVAASTSISRPPGKKSDQLLIQGNQINFVYNLLTEKYQIPKKYIRGLENAPKHKK